MPVPSTIADLDAVAANNSPAGSDSAKGTVDDFLRAHAAFIKQNNVAILLRAPIASPTFTGVVAGVTAAHVGAVALTGDQPVAGVKTFSSSPIVPAPTTDLQAATKKYVDDSAIGAAGVATILHAAVAKTTPVDADEFGLVDSAAAFGLKRLTWANLLAAVNAGIKAFFNASGTAPVYAVRAHGTLNGTGVPAMSTNGNFSATVADRGTGRYTLNFATALPDANYTLTGTSTSATASATLVGLDSTTPLKTATQVNIIVQTGGGTEVDVSAVNIVVVG